MDSRRGYLRALLHSLVTRVSMTGFRLVRNALIARVLGPEARGLFALISMVPELVVAVGSGGLNSALAYNAARNEPVGVLVARLAFFGAVFCLALALIAVSLLRSLPNPLGLGASLEGWVWAVTMAVPLFALKSGLLSVHNAAGHVAEFNHLRLIESVAPLVIFVVMFWAWADYALLAAVASWLLGTLVVVVMGCLWLAKHEPLAPDWTRLFDRDFFRYSAKSHPDVLFQQLLLRADFLIVAAMLGNEALGYYAVGKAAAELLLIIPESVTTPLMRRLLQQGEGASSLVPMALRLTGLGMVVACLGTAVIGELVILLLFGQDFLPAYPALVALLPGVLGLSFAGILRFDLLGRNRGGTISLITGLMALLNVTLSYALLPGFGIFGVALGSSIAYLTGSWLLTLVYLREAHVSPAEVVIMRVEDFRRVARVLGIGRP